MMVSTKGRYALMILTDLAVHAKDDYVSLADVGERQGISLKYLEAIVASLNKAGYVESRRGKSGGYTLAQGLYGRRCAQSRGGQSCARCVPRKLRRRLPLFR